MESDSLESDQDDQVDPEPPLYRYSWRRFAVVATALLTLPAWGPWVQANVGLQELMLIVPFIIILVVSIVFVFFMFPTRSIRRRARRDHKSE
ncbi:MAG: hypothetical protein HKN47_09695 [Pirellulaceae bacterium]|nr:hypothetical protein [Pirellulaceae bacterium]